MAVQEQSPDVISVILLSCDYDSRESCQKGALQIISRECKKRRQLAIPSDVVRYIAGRVYDEMEPREYEVVIKRRHLNNAVFNASSEVSTVNFPDTITDGDFCRVTEYELDITGTITNGEWGETIWWYEGPVRYRKCRSVSAWELAEPM